MGIMQRQENTRVAGLSDVKTLITSARAFIKHDKVHIDYRANNIRVRFSTTEVFSKRTFQRIDREVYSRALEHFLSTNEMQDENIYFEDVGLKSIEEGAHNRQSDIQEDYITIYEKYILPKFEGKKIDEIKVAHLRSWKYELLQEKSLSKSRYLKYHRCMNFIFKYIYESELREKNLMDLVDKKSNLFKTLADDGSSKYYSKEEIQLIVNNATGWFKCYITIALGIGVRLGTINALKWSDVDFEEETLTLQRSIRHGKLRNTTKTGITSVVDLPLPVKNELLKLKESAMSEEWIFPSPRTGLPYVEPKSINKRFFSPLLLKLGIKNRTMYNCRHSYATMMLNEGVSSLYVSKQLTHKLLSTTLNFYAKNGRLNKQNRDERVDAMFVS